MVSSHLKFYNKLKNPFILYENNPLKIVNFVTKYGNHFVIKI